MYYGDKRESKVNICHTLQSLGWTIYGYKEDKSDSMTDYYDPACWDGIATKNGYTLCIDVNYILGYSGKSIERYTRPNINFKTNAKIEQLDQLANDRGATDGEKSAALAAIERLKQKMEKERKQAELTKEIVCVYPIFQANPPYSNWHIEKDGVIIAKGRGAFQFHNLPWWVDHMTGKNKEDNYTRRAWELSEDQQKDLKKFQAFINKVESVVNLKIGKDDGSQVGYKKIVVTEYKTKLKPEKINLENLDEDLEPGICFMLRANFNYGSFKGMVYRIKDDAHGRILAVRLNKKYNKELTGRATAANSFNCSYEKFKIWVENGAIDIVHLVEVKMPYEVEKWIKETNSAAKQDRRHECVGKNSEDEEIDMSLEYNIKKDIDTRDDSTIYVVKINKKLSKEEYIKVKRYMKSLGGYYSRFKHGFLFKEDPSEVLNVDASEAAKVVRQSNKENLTDKIQKQIDRTQKKIQGLSGDYKTNTYKRMKEQEGRDKKIEGWQFDINLMQYLLNCLDSRDLTLFEENLIVSTFRNEMYSYYVRHKAYNNENKVSALKEIEFPDYYHAQPMDSWYNVEVPKQQKRLKKAGINNTEDLIHAVEEYGKIYDTASKPIDRTAQEIKRLESKYKLNQKGDINFTPCSLAEKLVSLAKISSDSVVLEPSAGIGSLADVIKEITNNVDVIERMSGFRELLKLKKHNLVGDDFLSFSTDKRYDAIVMNPPFSDEQNHIKHAYELLKADGVLVAVTSPHWTFAKDSAVFKEWVENEVSYTLDVEPGTFEMTDVATKILVIEKNGCTEEKSA